MNNYFDTAIVGGGASGLLCAVELLSGENALDGKSVLVLERNDRVGKKLLATGNGQGNLSNSLISAENYSGDRDFIASFIRSLCSTDPLAVLRQIGVYTVTDEEGRIYPISKQANSVLDAIRQYLAYKGALVITGERITEIKKDKAFCLVSESGKRFFADKVVLACGGKAGKQFGTDGSAYTLAASFGHKLTALYPSLVQLKTEKEKIRGLKGVKEYARVSLYDGDKKIKSAVGDLLFTDYGVSGNAVFKISGRVQGLTAPVLKIDFIPDISAENAEAMINDKRDKKFIPYQELLNGITHKKTGQIILKGSEKSTREIVKELKSFPLTVTGTLGFDNAQVTKGGIITKDINDNFESKLVKKLYITGEMLDIDGECGGYNLTFAFASGILAARDIKRSVLKGEIK